MLSKLSSMFGGEGFSKDKLLVIAVEAWVNTKYAKLGRVSDLVMDLKERRGSCQLHLVGEVEAIEVKVGRYDLVREGEQVSMVIEEIEISRAWMHELAQMMKEQEKLSVSLPSSVARFL